MSAAVRLPTSPLNDVMWGKPYLYIDVTLKQTNDLQNELCYFL